MTTNLGDLKPPDDDAMDIDDPQLSIRPSNKGVQEHGTARESEEILSYQKTNVAAPKEILHLDVPLENVFTYKTWKSVDASERLRLEQFLPQGLGKSELSALLHKLFDVEAKDYFLGAHPLVTFLRKLRSGELNLDLAPLMEQKQELQSAETKVSRLECSLDVQKKLIQSKLKIGMKVDGTYVLDMFENENDLQALRAQRDQLKAAFASELKKTKRDEPDSESVSSLRTKFPRRNSISTSSASMPHFAAPPARTKNDNDDTATNGKRKRSSSVGAAQESDFVASSESIKSKKRLRPSVDESSKEKPRKPTKAKTESNQSFESDDDSDDEGDRKKESKRKWRPSKHDVAKPKIDPMPAFRLFPTIRATMGSSGASFDAILSAVLSHSGLARSVPADYTPEKFLKVALQYLSNPPNRIFGRRFESLVSFRVDSSTYTWIADSDFDDPESLKRLEGFFYFKMTRDKIEPVEDGEKLVFPTDFPSRQAEVTIKPLNEESIKKYQEIEEQRFSDENYSKTFECDFQGHHYILPPIYVPPIRSKFSHSHPLFIERPRQASLIALVAFAGTFLPGGVGTRADIATLLSYSHYLKGKASFKKLLDITANSVERGLELPDPVMVLEFETLLWVHSHRIRSTEDFVAAAATIEDALYLQRQSIATAADNGGDEADERDPNEPFGFGFFEAIRTFLAGRDGASLQEVTAHLESHFVVRLVPKKYSTQDFVLLVLQLLMRPPSISRTSTSVLPIPEAVRFHPQSPRLYTWVYPENSVAASSLEKLEFLFFLAVTREKLAPAEEGEFPRWPLKYFAKLGGRTLPPISPEQIESMRSIEMKRFDNFRTYFEFEWLGSKSIIAPIGGRIGKGNAKKSPLLIDERKAIETQSAISTVLAALLPGGVGTRHDFQALFVSSRFAKPGLQEDTTIDSQMSSCLGFLKTIADSPVRFVPDINIWVYRHWGRSEEDFNRARFDSVNTPSKKKREKKKKSSSEPTHFPQSCKLFALVRDTLGQEGAHLIRIVDALKKYQEISRVMPPSYDFDEYAAVLTSYLRFPPPILNVSVPPLVAQSEETFKWVLPSDTVAAAAIEHLEVVFLFSSTREKLDPSRGARMVPGKYLTKQHARSLSAFPKEFLESFQRQEAKRFRDYKRPHFFNVEGYRGIAPPVTLVNASNAKKHHSHLVLDNRSGAESVADIIVTSSSVMPGGVGTVHDVLEMVKCSAYYSIPQSKPVEEKQLMIVSSMTSRISNETIDPAFEYFPALGIWSYRHRYRMPSEFANYDSIISPLNRGKFVNSNQATSKPKSTDSKSSRSKKKAESSAGEASSSSSPSSSSDSSSSISSESDDGLSDKDELIEDFEEVEPDSDDSDDMDFDE